METEDISQEKKADENKCLACGKEISEDHTKCNKCKKCAECCQCEEEMD